VTPNTIFLVCWKQLGWPNYSVKKINKSWNNVIKFWNLPWYLLWSLGSNERMTCMCFLFAVLQNLFSQCILSFIITISKEYYCNFKQKPHKVPEKGFGWKIAIDGHINGLKKKRGCYSCHSWLKCTTIQPRQYNCMTHFPLTKLSSVYLPKYYNYVARHMTFFRPNLSYNRGNNCMQWWDLSLMICLGIKELVIDLSMA
jgi:hypothetical protein